MVKRYDAQTAVMQSHSPVTSRVLVGITLSATLLVSTGTARAATEDSDHFTLGVVQTVPGNERAMLNSDRASFKGNPAKSAFSWWPEDLVVAPVPGYSPAIGWNIAIAGGYFLDMAGAGDDVPASLIGAGAMTSDNGSQALGAGGKFNLLNDRLRIEAALGALDLNYRFWGVGTDDGRAGQSIDVNQEGSLALVAAKWEVLPDLYIGLGYMAGDTTGVVRPGQLDVPDLPDPGIALNLAAVLVPLDFDSRDDEYFPRNGWKAGVRAFVYDEAVGSDFDATVYSLEVNRYLPMREHDVLALRGVSKSADDSAPFFLLSSFGGRTDLRGYENGRYRDNLMYAVQAEYRWRKSDRWAFTGFAGVGEVADNFGGFLDELLPAVGAEARFMISVEHQVSLAADSALGNLGTQFYFGVGEAF